MSESAGARLLLVILKVEGAANGSGRGSLTPVLANDVVAKAGADLVVVVRHADLLGLPRQAIFAFVLIHRMGASSAATELHLKEVADDLVRSGVLSRYAVFYRASNQLSISRAH